MSSGEAQPKRIWRALQEEPYRMFFPLGALGALLGGGYWFVWATGLSARYVPLEHGLMQVEGFANCFAIGFLLTALPRFMEARPGGALNLIVALALQVATMGLALAGRVAASQTAFLLLMGFVLAFAARCYRDRRCAPPPETVFVIAGLLHGIVGAALLLGSPAAWPRLGFRMIEQGMLMAYVLGIGSFLGPRLLGLWDPPVPVAGTGRWNPVRARLAWYGAASVLLFASFWIEAAVGVQLGRWLRVAVFVGQWGVVLRLYRLPKKRFLAGLLLWISWWFIVAGQMLNAAFPLYETTVLHVTFVGGFGLLVLMIGLRVTAAHGGSEALWQARALPATVGGLVLTALLARLGAVVWAMRYVPLLGVGGTLWMAAVLVWAVALVPRMVPRDAA